jgi:hypothetical protein
MNLPHKDEPPEKVIYDFRGYDRLLFLGGKTEARRSHEGRFWVLRMLFPPPPPVLKFELRALYGLGRNSTT